jgi:hypothetical protein
MATLLLLLISVAPTIASTDAETWTPPIGIPKPPFGIYESYRMYDEESVRNSNLVYQQSDSGGYFTHFVDSTDPNSTDKNNLYGSPDKPRKTIPKNLPAGSVVEVHNNADKNRTGRCYISGSGMAQQPIFVRGIDMPRIEAKMRVGYVSKTRYLIVEGISFYSGGVSSGSEGGNNTSHVAVRNCDFRGDTNGGGFFISGHNPNFSEYVVFYNNLVHDNGIWDPKVAEGDRDIGELGVGTSARYVWLIYNEVYHVESTGIIIAPYPQNVLNTAPECPHHVYIAKNIVHHNKQDGIFMKTAHDVIISQNISYGHRPSSSSSGSGFGFQYDPKRLWFLFNRSYDNNKGFGTGSPWHGNEYREDIHFIGNLVYDCIDSGIQVNGLNMAEPAGIFLNTIYNCPEAIDNSYYSSKVNILNNVIAKYTKAINFTSANTTFLLSNMDYNLLDGSGTIQWSGDNYNSLAALMAGERVGYNCIEADPLFKDPDKGDFHLQPTSPIMNMSISETVQTVFDRFEQLYGIDLAKDIDGEQRIWSSDMIDISTSSDVSPSPNPQEVEASEPDIGGSSTPSNIGSTKSRQETEKDVSNSKDSNTPDKNDSTRNEQEESTDKSNISNRDKKTIKYFNRTKRRIMIRRIYDRFEQLYGSDSRGKNKKEYFE